MTPFSLGPGLKYVPLVSNSIFFWCSSNLASYVNLGTTKIFGQEDNPESCVSGDECGVDVYSVSSLQDEASDEAGV